MERFFIKLATVLFLLTAGMAVHAQKKERISVTTHSWYGVDIEQKRPNSTSHGYMTYEATVDFHTSPADSCIYAHTFGYPMFSIGFSWARASEFKFSDRTKFPDLYTLFGAFERTVIRGKYISLGYILNFGVTYNPDRYNPAENPGNNWLSSPVMAYVGAGAVAKLHLGKRWEIGTDIMFRHYSNGRLRLPNEALNAAGAGIFARYRLDDYDHRRYKNIPIRSTAYKRGMEYAISLGFGVHTCMGEFEAIRKEALSADETKERVSGLKAHPKLSLSFNALYRYSLKHATGIGIDLFYSSNMNELERSDRIVYGDEAVDNSPGYDPFSVGISLVHQVYWRNLAVHIAIGAYPYRRKGVDGELAEAMDDRERGRHYEKAGLRYHFPKFGNTFLGFAVKAHSFKSEYLEFSFGIKL